MNFMMFMKIMQITVGKFRNFRRNYWVCNLLLYKMGRFPVFVCDTIGALHDVCIRSKANSPTYECYIMLEGNILCRLNEEIT